MFGGMAAFSDEGAAGARWHPAYKKTHAPRIRANLLGISAFG
jgi:hypothetical protein